MRIPLVSDPNNYFSKTISPAYEKLKETYFNAVCELVRSNKIQVMLNDGTITTVDSFEPSIVKDFFSKLQPDPKWNNRISSSTTENLDRLYCQLSTTVKNYSLIFNFVIQYHSYPYYKPDARIINIKKELFALDEIESRVIESIASRGDEVIQEFLKKEGVEDLNSGQLLEMLINNEQLTSEIEKKVAIIENNYPEHQIALEKKTKLQSEIKTFIMYSHTTSPVQIDYNKLIQGEEGIVSYLDILRIDNNKSSARSSEIDTAKVSRVTIENIRTHIEEVTNIIGKFA